MVMYGCNLAGEWDDPFPASVNYQARVLKLHGKHGTHGYADGPCVSYWPWPLEYLIMEASLACWACWGR